MSIKGRPYVWFRAGLESRDLAQIRSAVAELRWVNLLDALAVLQVISEMEPDLYDRAACRWLARVAAEREVGLEQLATAIRALERLGGGSQSALEKLTALAKGRPA